MVMVNALLQLAVAVITPDKIIEKPNINVKLSINSYYLLKFINYTREYII